MPPRDNKMHDFVHGQMRKQMRRERRSVVEELLKKPLRSLYAKHRGRFLGILFVSVVVVGFGIYHFVARANLAVLYPASCLGGWNNVHNAEGKPDVGAPSTTGTFNDGNSAVLPENTIAEMYCGSFTGNIPEDSQPKKIMLTFSWASQAEVTAAEATIGTSTDTANALNSISADISSSTNATLATSTMATTSTGMVLTGTSTPDNSVIIVLPINAPAPVIATTTEVSTTTLDAPVPAPVPVSPASGTPSDTIQSSIFNLFIKQAFAATEDIATTSSTTTPQTPTGFLEIDYTIDGAQWNILGVVDEAHLHSATFEIPIATSSPLGSSTDPVVPKWRDMSNIQIKIKSISSMDVIPRLYLDGMSLQVVYGDEDVGFKTASGLYVGHVQVDASSSIPLALQVKNDGNTQNLIVASPNAPLGGIAVYSATSSALLMTTYVSDFQYALSPEYFGIGDYYIILTDDSNNCVNESISECRQKSGLKTEGGFSVVNSNTSI